jgi:hypothetical protein
MFFEGRNGGQHILVEDFDHYMKGLSYYCFNNGCLASVKIVNNQVEIYGEHLSTCKTEKNTDWNAGAT